MQIYRGTREVKVQAQNRLTFAIRHTHKQTKASFPKNKKNTGINTAKRPCHTG